MAQKTNLTETELYEKAQRLVQNEVFCCVTAEVEEMLKAEILQWDDIENGYLPQCPECGEFLPYQEEVETQKGLVCPYCEKNLTKLGYQEYASLDYEPQEIFEWWAVSDWLADKLREKGQPILEGPGCLTYWGRTTTGQAIYMDYVIRQIVEEL